LSGISSFVSLLQMITLGGSGMLASLVIVAVSLSPLQVLLGIWWRAHHVGWRKKVLTEFSHPLPILRNSSIYIRTMCTYTYVRQKRSAFWKWRRGDDRSKLASWNAATIATITSCQHHCFIVALKVISHKDGGFHRLGQCPSAFISAYLEWRGRWFFQNRKWPSYNAIRIPG
jgi:hypothetical protein